METCYTQQQICVCWVNYRDYRTRHIRIISYYNPLISINELHVSNKLPYLVGRRQAHMLHFMYKRAQQPKFIDNRNLLTRAHDKKLLVVYQPKTEKVKSCLAYKGSIAWNMLDINIESSATSNNFKFKTKKLALENLAIWFFGGQSVSHPSIISSPYTIVSLILIWFCVIVSWFWSTRKQGLSLVL